MDGVQWVGSAGSSVANLVLFGVVAALWSHPPHFLHDSSRAVDRETATMFRLWWPLIDNPGMGRLNMKEPECPAPWGGDHASLVDAPLPVGFDAHAYTDRALYACVLVGRRGEVLDANILRGTWRSDLDRSIVDTIRSDWSFRVYWGFRPKYVSWQRVRLNPAPASPVIYPGNLE